MTSSSCSSCRPLFHPVKLFSKIGNRVIKEEPKQPVKQPRDVFRGRFFLREHKFDFFRWRWGHREPTAMTPIFMVRINEDRNVSESFSMRHEFTDCELLAQQRTGITILVAMQLCLIMHDSLADIG